MQSPSQSARPRKASARTCEFQIQCVGQSVGSVIPPVRSSVSGEDEINLVASATAKGLGAKQVVARVSDPMYTNNSILYETILGIDYVLSTNALTASEVAQYIETPGIVAAETFGRGLVEVRQVRVAKSPTTDGRTLKDIIPPQTGVLLGVINRAGKIVVPHGDTIVEKGDLATFIGLREKMADVQKRFQGKEPPPKSVVVMGGGSIGLHLAQGLENRQRSVKLFDWNLARCGELSGLLSKTKVVCRDATSRAALEEEHVDETDVFVATTDDDERNIMASVLAKEVGVNATIAVVHQPDFAPLVTKLGIDHAVTPRACIANRILRIIRQGEASSLAVLGEGKVEVLEFGITADTAVIGKQLKDVRFPSGALVGAILRADQVIVPSGDDEFHAGDSVILIVAADCIEAVQKLFQQ